MTESFFLYVQFNFILIFNHHHGQCTRSDVINGSAETRCVEQASAPQLGSPTVHIIIIISLIILIIISAPQQGSPTTTVRHLIIQVKQMQPEPQLGSPTVDDDVATSTLIKVTNQNKDQCAPTRVTKTNCPTFDNAQWRKLKQMQPALSSPCTPIASLSLS